MTAATTRDALREMIADAREVFSANGPETPQIVRDVIEYVDSWMTVYLDKRERIFPATPAAATGADAEPVAKGADEAVARPSIAKLLELIGDYWDLAYDEGKEGRKTDTAEGAANACYASILAECRALRDRTGQPVSDRAAALEMESQRLDWLLANPNTVCEDAGNEWFILDDDSEPTYFKSGREAIDAARALAAKEKPHGA